MAEGPEIYVYYEKSGGHTHVPGYCASEFKYKEDVRSFVKVKSDVLTRVFDCSDSIDNMLDDKGLCTAKPTQSVWLEQEMDISVVKLLKIWANTEPLNVGVLFTSRGARARGGQVTESKKDHRQTLLLAQARVTDIDVSRTGGADQSDIVRITLQFQGAKWYDHDQTGCLDEWTWKDEDSATETFASLWNEDLSISGS